MDAPLTRWTSARHRAVAAGVAGVVTVLMALGGLTGVARAVTVQRWSTPAPQYVNPSYDTDESGQMITNVVLPDGYASRRCWPVLYLLHGTQAGSQPAATQWLTLDGGVLTRMDIPAILVIPGSGDSWYVNDWSGGTRQPAFESWMLRDVVPLAARRLHICPGRSQHAIAGLSMGAYGAIYLASQLPGYFGSAGAFSGPLSPESWNFSHVLLGPATFSSIWGPVGGSYAVGHDPVALVANLRHTRVFVGVGDGELLPGETDIASTATEETEYEQESIAFAAAARAAGVPVTFDIHGGEHTDLTWLTSLQEMLAWNPFAHVVADPRTWTYSTVSSSGSAWGYRFAFPTSASPRRVIQLSQRNGTLRVRGAGTVTITTPSGHVVSGAIPFDVTASGRRSAAPGASVPRLRGGATTATPVTVAVAPAAPDETLPLQVSFRATAALPAGEEYQIGRIALSDTTGSCDDNVWERVGSATVGQVVTATLAPPATATFPGQWCSGTAVVAVSRVPTDAPSTVPGTILGLSRFTIS